MNRRTFLEQGSFWAGSVFMAVTIGSSIAEPNGAAQPNEKTHRWFSLPIDISRLPNSSGFIPVSIHVNFDQILKELRIEGAVDERSIRLFRGSGWHAQEVPFQFSTREQPRPEKRTLLPGTSPTMSYLGEYGPEQVPKQINVDGDLTWIVRGTSQRSERFVLRFGIPKSGRFVQVPFGSQNLHAFDDASRATPPRWFDHMQMHPQWPFESKIDIFDRTHLVTSYHLGPISASDLNSIRRPFLYPVNGPDGVSLTEFGKPHDPTGSHAHHYSLWIAHANVNGNDFWSEKGGVIAHEQLKSMEDGSLFSRLVQTTKWISKNGIDLLRETRSITVYEQFGDFRIIDFETTLKPSGSKEITFGQTSFGFLAARVAQSMTVFDGGGEIRNSNGDRNEQNAHLKRARWLDQSGPIGQNRWGGIAILDHPGNPNHPTGWHCRNDGWAGASFNMEAPYTLQPGGELTLRYRVHLHRHDASRGGVEQRFVEYSAVPQITIGRGYAGR
jgi:hypothetical protein